jgi:large subunit ribosomal protein L44e
MKVPKTIKRLCPRCKKHTEHKVTIAKKKTPGSAHPLSKGSQKRRDFGKGMGNLGTRGSKPALSKFKMTGKKQTKKTDFRYQCSVCQKQQTQRRGIRAKKVELV